MSLGRAVGVWPNISAAEMDSLTQLHRGGSLTAGDKHLLSDLLLRPHEQARRRLRSRCLISVNKDHLLPVGAGRVPPYFLCI